MSGLFIVLTLSLPIQTDYGLCFRVALDHAWFLAGSKTEAPAYGLSSKLGVERGD